MKLTALYLDDIVVVPAGKSLGDGQARVDVRDSSFHASEGWDIHEVSTGVFSLQCKGMPVPVTVGGYGYAYTAAAELKAELELPVEESTQAQRERARRKR